MLILILKQKSKLIIEDLNMSNEHCNGKVMFSKAGADSFIKGKKMSRITKKKLRTYFHKECGHYHLTTSIDGIFR